MNNNNNNKKKWTGSRIKSLPYVENTVPDKKGGTRKLSVEEMLSRFNKRVAKSGVLEEHIKNRRFTKPSTKRRLKRKEVAFRLKKQDAYQKKMNRLRDMGK